MDKASLFKDIIPSILQTKKIVITEENEKDYIPFLVNRALSLHQDCVLFANEMNKNHSLDRLPQFHYLINTVRDRRRPFQKWHKLSKNEDLDAIKEYYNYSDEKANDVLSLLSDDQINDIRNRIRKGGLQNDKHKRSSRGDSS